MQEKEELYMLRAIHLAELGSGKVAPNPLVGAVLVYADKIIGEGYHREFGKEHAEVNAIQDAIRKGNMSLISKSTLYVTLEPCSHFGKTPPCTDLILDHHIPHVVVGNRDPFPLVSGRGIEKLISAGVKVETGFLDEQCYWMNRRFMTFHTRHRPYIIVKYAQTADHFIAAEDCEVSKKISSLVTDVLVHRWRSEEQGILVGTTTALTDNPQLNVRHWNGKNPVRMVIDRSCKLPPELKLFDQSQKTLIFNEKKDFAEGLNEYVKINFDQQLAENILAELYKRNIQSVIIEGGTKLLNLFISRKLWDEARIITSSKIFGKGTASPEIHGEEFHRDQADDEIVYLKPI